MSRSSAPPLHQINWVRPRGPIPSVESAPLSFSQRATVFRLGSVLLAYPSSHWEDLLPEVQKLNQTLPVNVASGLTDFCQWAKTVGQRAVEAAYVETFDQRRRCCLELTYYSTGDTRQRGVALSIFKDLYAAVGYELTGSDLPDFLPNVLELASTCEGDDADLVYQVLASHQDGIEVLHSALTSLHSPWAGVVGAVRMALPQADAQLQQRVSDLIRTGPPQELVGLEQPTITGSDFNRSSMSATVSLEEEKR